MSGDTPEERQNSEFEALQAIFGNDLVDNRLAIAWKVWRPLDLILNLKPLHNSTINGSHCFVMLKFKCGASYPNITPEISIVKLGGLSNDDGARLIEELDAFAKTLLGEVMIYDLATYAQNFLYQHNRPIAQSFYDEMVQRNNEMEQLKIHDKQIKEDQEREAMIIEVERRQALLKAGNGSDESATCEIKQEQEQLVYYAAEKAISPKSKRKRTSVDDKCFCASRGVQVLRIYYKNVRKIHVGKCLGHSIMGATSHCGIDSDTGELVVVRKWFLPAPKDLQARNKQMNVIDQDIAVLSRIKHVNIVPYLAVEAQHEITERNRSSYTTVCLVRDFIRGSSLSDLQSDSSPVAKGLESLSFVKTLGIGVFSALSELHSLNLCHGDVRPENVFLDSSGVVKLVGACLDVRLCDMLEDDFNCNSYTKDQDISSSAHLLLSLISDRESLHQEIPSHLPSILKDFFSRCLTDDEGRQWSAAKLLEHDFLKAPSVPHQIISTNNPQEDEEDEAQNAFSVVSSVTGGSSRLEAEFEILKWLGRGAFGDVLKVRNKLDGGLYAIKRIVLNPEKVQINKSITREVTLLSRLNHENVVRYYNAWIETANCEVESTDSSEHYDDVEPKKQQQKTKMAPAAKDLSACVARLAPNVKLEWSMSDVAREKKNVSEQDDDDDDGWFKCGFSESESVSDGDSFIEFEIGDGDDKEEVSEQSQSNEQCSGPIVPTFQNQLLYIQMEFCERNTLRQAIDNGLYLEKIRAWRLFREIVEGLAHVHQRGMIHRDLKPMNIFIDSNDHVKIGDFGLATKVLTGLHHTAEEKSKTQDDFAGSLTGQVGTALYVAPELLQAANKVIYNQKVDIYSLGIILFEMFHPPLNTAMERMKILTDLRTKELVMPKNFQTDENSKQVQVIRWLVSHEPSARPTCSEILSSALIPRAFADDTLDGLLSHALANKKSRPHARLIAACMEQTFTLAEDLTYDSGVKTKHDNILTIVKDVVVEVFKTRGAVEYSPPLLMPKIEKARPFGSRLMTSFGGVVNLPHDLRYPFARHIVYSDITSMRRYYVGKVFRERKAAGFHPKELPACAFDVCAPLNVAGIWLDAELISIIHSITKKLGVQVNFQVSHRDILDGVLESCGIPKEKYPDVYPVLAELATGRIGKLQIQTHLSSLCLPTRDTAALLKFLELRTSVHQAATCFTSLTKSSRNKVVPAIAQLTDLDKALKALGVECDLTLVGCLSASAVQHDGIFWHATTAQAQSNTHTRHSDLLAIGGRYGALLDEFFEIAKGKSFKRKVTAVGLTINMERIANILRRKRLDAAQEFEEIDEPIRVAVCFPPGQRVQNNSAAANLAGALWSSGVPTAIIETPNCEEAHELLNACTTLVPLSDAALTNSVALTHWDTKSGSVTERRVHLNDAVQTVLDIMRKRNGGSIDSKSRIGESTSLNIMRSTSESLNVNFIFVREEREGRRDDRGAIRRRIEAQAFNKVQSWCSRSGFRGGRVSCVCVSLPLQVLSAVAARPNQEILQLYPHHRRLLSEVLEAINHRTDDETQLQFLYSLIESHYVVVT